MPVQISLKAYLRVGIISFGAGAVASFLAGMMTSGLAAAYAIVSMWTWGVVSKIGGEALANEGWVVVSLTALIHGFVFSLIAIFGRLAFPRLRQGEWSGNVLLLATVVYGVLLAFAFPVRP